LDVAGRSLDVAILFFRALEIASGTPLTSEKVLAHAEHASHRKRPSSVDPLPHDERAVRRPEVFHDHIAVEDTDEAVQARDIVVREDDVDMWIPSRNHGTFREPDPSSHLAAALDHHERQHLLNRNDPIVKCVMPTRRSASRRHSRA
jgi:hypothetical protein